MANIDKRIDDYITGSESFAQPVLTKLRRLVHIACPHVTETIKWGMPYFEYKGLLCHMAGFKHHCAFGFWKAELMHDAAMLIENNGKAMGHAGKITSLKDLPDDRVIIERIKEAAKLNEEGIKLPVQSRNNIEIIIPEILFNALHKKRSAYEIFNKLPPSHRKEYVNWINEAKTMETKMKRCGRVVEMVLSGKQKRE